MAGCEERKQCRMNAGLIEVIPHNCRGCRLCEMACSFRHEKECSTSKSRIRILKDNDWAFDFPLLCIQCDVAPCIPACPIGAISRNERTGVVLIDEGTCSGCGICISACPVSGLALDGGKGIVIKCDLCGGDPECVKWCPNQAIILKEAESAASDRKTYVEQAHHLIRTASFTGKGGGRSTRRRISDCKNGG